jgi:ParB-like chromosome segregation protein Spo0J
VITVALFGLGRSIRYAPLRTRTAFCNATFRCHGHKTDNATKADSLRTQGVLSPLLVRPLTEHGFEIVAGARRYRAAQAAETATVPVRIVHLSDAEALEAQLMGERVTAPPMPIPVSKSVR